MFDRSPDHGYFEGRAGADGQRDYVNPGGIGVTNVDSFISWYKTKLNGNSQERAMASFTIRTMVGQQRGSADQKGSVPSSTVAEWEKRVRAYADPNVKDRSVNFNRSFSFKKNTYYQMNNNDIGWYYETDTQPAIVFTNPDGTTYAIKRSCANPVGELVPLDEDSGRWSLKEPLTEIRKNGGEWNKQVGVKPGDRITTRYHVSNATRTTTDRFERWRSMNFNEGGTITSSWRDGSKTTETSLGGSRSVTSGESSFTIPSNARSRTAYCWRASVDPRASDDGRVLTGAPVCAVVGGVDEKYPSWSLTLSSAVHPFVEQGNAVEWVHNIVNTDPNNRGGKVADGFNRCMVFSYDRYDPNAGWGGGGTCGTNYKASVPPGGAYRQIDDAYILQTNGGTSLGATYCQRYSVGKQAEFNPVVGESPNACTTVVGGKTRLSVNQPSEGEVEPTRQVTLTADLRTDQYTTAGGYTGYGIGCQYNVTAQLPNGASQTLLGSTSCTTHIDSNDPRGVVNYPYTPTEADMGKRICLNVSIWPANGNENLMAAGASRTGQSCFEVVAKPYIKVVGGDIAASRCSGSGSIIAGWNKLSDESSADPAMSNYGAGAQYAAYAQGIIRGFASGQYINRQAPVSGIGYGFSPTNLSFANQGTDPKSGNFGGNFAGTPCPPSYYSTTALNTAANWPGMAAASTSVGIHTYKHDARTTPLRIIGNNTVQSNVNATLYVDGDVIIEGNIGASYAGAIDIAQIPNFRLIARGNIYIQPNVTELNGSFIAEGNGKGQLYTCTNGVSPWQSDRFSNARPVPLANPYSMCNQRLVVNGSVVAKKVHLQRTFGSMYKDTSQAAGIASAAEVFNFNPLIWMLGSTGDSNISNDDVDEMTILPPVL